MNLSYQALEHMKTLALLLSGLVLAMLLNGCCCSPCGGGMGGCGTGACGMQGAYYTPPCSSGCGI